MRSRTAPRAAARRATRAADAKHCRLLACAAPRPGGAIRGRGCPLRALASAFSLPHCYFRPRFLVYHMLLRWRSRRCRARSSVAQSVAVLLTRSGCELTFRLPFFVWRSYLASAGQLVAMCFGGQRFPAWRRLLQVAGLESPPPLSANLSTPQVADWSAITLSAQSPRCCTASCPAVGSFPHSHRRRTPWKPRHSSCFIVSIAILAHSPPASG